MGCNDCDPPPTEEDMLEMEQNNTGLIEWMRSLVSGIISSTDGNGNDNFTEGTNDGMMVISLNLPRLRRIIRLILRMVLAANRVFFCKNWFL
jgi:hypothetical protein